MSFLGSVIKIGSLGLLDPEGDARDAATAARNAQGAATAAETEMFEKNMEFQREMWDWQKQQAAPWQEAGLRGLGGYENLLNNPWGVANLPGYQFGLSQGTQAIDRSASAEGMNLSGATLKGLNRYGQDYGLSNWRNFLGDYQTLANYGVGATSNAMNQGANYASGLSNLYAGQGQNLSQYHTNMGQINANQAMMPWNTAMQVANLGLSAYGMMSPGGMGGGTVGGGSFLNPVSSNVGIGLFG